MERQVKLKVSMAGTDVSYKPGDVLPVSQEAAEAWEAAGIADILTDGTRDTGNPAPAASVQVGRKKRG